MFELTQEKIRYEDFLTRCTNLSVGGVVTFEGRVRDHNEGKKVSSLEYEVYVEMAKREGEKIIQEALSRFEVEETYCVHRYGHLLLGEIAVFVMANAHHREAAFKACRYIIDEVKRRVPIWKKEHYIDFPSEWVACHDCQHTHVDQR